MTTNYIHSVLNDKFYIIEISFIEYRIQYYRKTMSLHRTPTVLIRHMIYPALDKTRYIAKTNIQVAKNKTSIIFSISKNLYSELFIQIHNIEI